MNRIKFNWGSFLVAAASIGIGITILANPPQALNVAKLLISAALLCGGLLKCIEYFAKDPQEASFLFGDLSWGFAMIALGIALNIKTQNVILSITTVIGIFILLAGFGGIEIAATAVRKGESSVLLRSIYAILTVAAGLIVLLFPFKTAENFVIFTGAALIIDGTLLITAIIQVYVSRKKDMEKKKGAINTSKG